MNSTEGSRVGDSRQAVIAGGSLPTSIVAAAHELKTPLVLIRQLSLQLAETDDDKSRSEIIRRIRLTSERSLRLVDNLTRMARLEDAMFELEPIQLINICHEAVDELAPLSQALGQQFLVRTSRTSPVAVGNRDLIRSMLTGLIDNALQYNSESNMVEVQACTRQGEALISVRDHGPVMDLREFRRLSDALGRRATPISNRPLSSGLGLVIANSFVGAMSGRLSITRHASGGVTFRAHLPVSAQLSFPGV